MARATTREKTGQGRGEFPRSLINHRDVADLFGTSPRNWRLWVNRGEVPVPHQQIGTLLLYDREVIRHRLDTGLWPEGVTYRATSGGQGGAPEAEGRTLPSDDETLTG
jgi:hypothetical protein